jgi:quinol monooxygenase YgiN
MAKYGTVARMQVKPGKAEQLMEVARRQLAEGIKGHERNLVFRSDSNPNEFWLAVAFESREAYRQNAESPEQHARYEELRALLEADPEWHDGEIVDGA